MTPLRPNRDHLFANPPAPIPFAAISCRNVIDSELRLIAAVRRTAAEVGMPAPRIGPADELLDEWNAIASGSIAGSPSTDT